MGIFGELRRAGSLFGHPSFWKDPVRVFYRALVWALHCLLNVPAKARFARWGFRLYLPPIWRGGGSTAPFLFRDRYEPELRVLERFLKPGMVFVDGGANTGVYTFTAASLVGREGLVIAFEPGVATFSALEKSKLLNQFSHVILRRQALSDRVGFARLYHHAAQMNSFSIGAPAEEAVPTEYEDVELTTIQQVLAECDIPEVHFIKLDIEGAEELALRGSSSLLTQQRPIVLFEANPKAARRLSLAPDGALRALRQLDYDIYSVDHGGQLRPAVGKGPTSGAENYIALPKSQPGSS